MILLLAFFVVWAVVFMMAAGLMGAFFTLDLLRILEWVF